MIATVREGLTAKMAASTVQGILRQAFQKWGIVVCAKMAEWSEIVVELEDPAGTKAWDAARRLGNANKREVIPRDPH